MGTTINPTKMYSQKEIVDLKLIPGADTYGRIYNLVTHLSKDGKDERIINIETTNRSLKSEHLGTKWSKNSGKILVAGKEIIKFLQINKLL